MPTPPSVTVYASPSDLYVPFLEQMQERLPLRSVKWWDTGAKRTHLIPELPLKISKHEPPPVANIADGVNRDPLTERAAEGGGVPGFDDGGPGEAVDLMEEPSRPLVHIAVVRCDDAAKYKGQLKDQLARWQQSLSEFRSSKSWLIVNINSKALPKGKQRLTLFDTVHDKIKSDFGGKSDQDRCLQLRDDGSPVASELWDELLARLETELFSSFNDRTEVIEKVIHSVVESFGEGKSFEGDAKSTGDSGFCKYFLLKDTLGRSFESVGLLKQALSQYDALEREFERYLEKSNVARDGITRGSDAQWLTWFHTECLPTCTQGAPIGVELDDANFRRRVQQRKVVVFEMRQYVLHRQTSLLFVLGEPPEAAQRVLKLILQIVPEMHADWPMVRPLFVRQWAILTCLDAIRCAEAYLAQGGRGLALSARIKYALVRANLVMYAKRRLEEIGTAGGLLAESFYLGFCATPDIRFDGSDDASGNDARTPTPSSPSEELAGSVFSSPTTAPFPALKITRTCGELLPALSSEFESAAIAAATAVQQRNASSPIRRSRAGSQDISVVESGSVAESAETSRFRRRQSSRAQSVMALTSRPALELLQDASQSREGFDYLYTSLCQVAIDSFKQANRVRSSLGLFCDMAALQFCRGEWADAVDQLAVAARQFRRDRWFELEFRLLGPMVECYQRIGAHDLYVDTILRVLSKDCPASLVAEQPRFGDRLLTYASSDEVPVTCNADSVLAVEVIEEAPSSAVPSVRRVMVRVRNCTATDLVFQSAVLTYEETMASPESLTDTPEIGRRGSSMASVASYVVVSPGVSAVIANSPSPTDAPQLVNEVDLASPERRAAITEPEREAPGDDGSLAGVDVNKAGGGDGDGSESEGLDQLQEELIHALDQTRNWLSTRRTQAQRERDFSYRTDVEIVLPAGVTSDFVLERRGDRYGGQFVPRTLMLSMGKLTLLALQLPPCREDQGPRNSLGLEAELSPIATPLIKGVASNIVVDVRRGGAPEDPQHLLVTAHGNMLVKLTASNDSGRDDEFGTSVPALAMDEMTKRIPLTILFEASDDDRQEGNDETVNHGSAVETRRKLWFALSNSDATASVDLVFEVPLRATSAVTETDGRAYLTIELQNTLIAASIILHKCVLREAVADGSTDDCCVSDDLNGLLEWPVYIAARQRVSFVWRLPARTGKRVVQLGQWSDILSASRQLYDAAFEFSVVPPRGGGDSGSAQPLQQQPLLTFSHKAAHVEPVCRFLADLVYQPRGGSQSGLDSTVVPTVGEFTLFEVRVGISNDFVWSSICGPDGAPSPLLVRYTVDVDTKRWMVSGKIRGQFSVMTGDVQGILARETILLLPLVSGLLHLPTIKLQCLLDGNEMDVPVINQHRADQIRVFPGRTKPSTTRLSVY